MTPSTPEFCAPVKTPRRRPGIVPGNRRIDLTGLWAEGLPESIDTYSDPPLFSLLSSFQGFLESFQIIPVHLRESINIVLHPRLCFWRERFLTIPLPMNTPQSQPQTVVVQQKSGKGCWIALWIVLGLGVLSIGGCFLLGGLFVAGVNEIGEAISEELKEMNAIPEENTPIGETAQTDNFAVTVKKAEITMKLADDSGVFTASPSKGGMFITVLWSYKNITSDPISSFSTPTVYLLSPEGTRYSADVEASGVFASISDQDENILSDLNPGIEVNAADAFEVSKDLYEKQSGQWRILIDSDRNVVFPAP